MSEWAVQPQVDLSAANSLALPCRAAQLARCSSLAQLRQARGYAQQYNLPITLFGGGSNLLCPPTIDGLVVKIEPPTGASFSVVEENGSAVVIEAAAGVSWSELVDDTVVAGLAGLENLALIPGTVGAAPVQNIGAYGVELAERFEQLDFYDWQRDTVTSMTAGDCQFGYRDSVFKHRLGGQGVIVSLRLRLQREPAASYRTDYPPLAAALAGREVTAAAIAAAVTSIRQSKLPDPAQLPNAGSFFKNPLLASRQLEALSTDYPALPHYPSERDGWHKVPAAWLIEQSGCKQLQRGGLATHRQQPLVIVNRGGATLDQLLAFAGELSEAVHAQFGVALEIEPQRCRAVWLGGQVGGECDAV